ncbi:MAG: hypothetical protein ACK41G_09540 [Candidatus Thermochlorobacter sp.]
MKYLLMIFCFAAALAACRTIDAPTSLRTKCFDASTLTAEERALADSLLALGLDNEALYTLFAPLKPISTVAQFSLALARSDSLPAGIRHAINPNAPELERLRQYQRIVNALRSERVELLLIPFRRTDKGKRFFEIVAIDKRLLADIIRRDQAFWGQWGFVPESNLAVMLTVTEFEEKLDRYRAYGYLFGYPEYAVTFFVEAAREQDSTKKLVARDFFQIPTYSAKQGRFVYAIPKGHTPSAIDSALYRAAEQILRRYQSVRARYVGPDGRLRALELLQENCSP